MATAAKFRIDVAIHDLLMNSTQMPASSPARSDGHDPYQSPCTHSSRIASKILGPRPRLKSATGGLRIFTAIHEDGWPLTFARAFCLGSFIRSPRIYLSNTNAISIAGIAGPMTTKLKA